jgi:hypothetical protein
MKLKLMGILKNKKRKIFLMLKLKTTIMKKMMCIYLKLMKIHKIIKMMKRLIPLYERILNLQETMVKRRSLYNNQKVKLGSMGTKTHTISPKGNGNFR